MSVEENKEKLQRFFVEVYNQGNLDALSEFVTADYVDHALPAGLTGFEGLEAYLMRVQEAFPDLQLHVVEILGESDKVACRTSLGGHFRSDLFGVHATGKEVLMMSISIYRFVDGKIAERWGLTDTSALMQTPVEAPVSGPDSGSN